MTPREKIAVMLLDRDEDGFIDLSPDRTIWARGFITAMQASEHYGDCTSVPMTCSRCVCDRVLADADKIIAAINP